MNANMKRLLIFALVPVTVWGIGSTFTKQKIDRIGVNTESQITMEDTTRFSSGTASTVPYLDASKDLVSSSVTPTELGYLSGVSSSIQIQINGKQDPVSGTANEIDFASDIIGLADNPILPGLEGVTIPSGATGDRPVSPNTGQFRWNTDNAEAEIYDGSQWGAVGGGAGGSRLNLLDDPSFEKGVANGSCTGCTATQDTTDYLATPNNEASLKMAFSAASGNYTWTESTSAQYSNVAGVVSAWIKTSASDCHFDELVDGTQSQTVAIGSSDEWKQYIINGTTGTTSYGWRVRCDTAITDDVFVDETFAGAAEPDVFDIGTASLFAKADWVNNTNCTWSNSVTNTTPQNFAADSDCNDPTVFGNYASAPATKIPGITFSYMPAGTYKFVLNGNRITTLGNSGLCLWDFSNGTVDTENDFGLVNLASSALYHGGFDGTIKISSPITSSTTFQIRSSRDGGSTLCQIDNSASSKDMSISVYHYPAPQKVVAAKCDGLECQSDFSAKISSGNVITNESSDWLTTSSESTNIFTVLFQSGVFSVAPNCSAVPKDGTSNTKCNAYNESTSQVNIACRNVGGSSDSAVNVDMMLYCHRGSDANQFDSRFIPISDNEKEQYRATDWGGLSSNNLAIPYFNNVQVNTLSQYGTMVNTSGDGACFTASRDVKVDATIWLTATATNGYAGFSKNASASQLDTDIAAITDEAVNLGYHTQSSAAVPSVFSTSENLVSGDVFCAHTITGRTPEATAARSGISFVFSPVNQKAVIGNLTPKEFVQTPGSTKPVMYSAQVQSNGTVALETGNFINGNCTNADPMVCTLESGAFSQNPICVLTESTSTNGIFCEFNAQPTTSSLSIRCFNDAGSVFTTSVNKQLICHGVQ